MESAFIDDIAAHIRSHKIPIENIFDLGACDLEESVYLSQLFPSAQIFSFEANPEKAEICRSKEGGKISFFPVAAGDRDGFIEFFIANDPRQSSTYPINSEKFRSLLGMGVDFKSTAIVQVMRLDSLPVTPDLLFMDIQGSEKNALLGLGERLKDVKIIGTELMLKSTYDGVPLFDEVDEMLKPDFEIVRGDPFYGVFDNYIYINRRFM